MIKIKQKKTCDQSNVYELEMSFIARNRVQHIEASGALDTITQMAISVQMTRMA